MSNIKGCEIYLEVEPDVLNIVKNNVYSFGCSIERIDYKSKYNSYLVYDFEPFCIDGFIARVKLTSMKGDNLKAFIYYYDSKMQKIDYLNRCYKMECYKKNINTNINFNIEKHFS